MTSNVRHARPRVSPYASLWALIVAAALALAFATPTAQASRLRAPLPPRDFTLSAINETTVTLTWADASSDETRFEVTNAVVVRTVAANQTSYVWTGLLSSTWWCFAIRSVNASGASAWVPTGSPHYRCAWTPSAAEDNYIALPLQPRSHAHVDGVGLHARQWSYLVDDYTGNTFTFTNPNQPYALDFDADPLSQASVYAIEDGVIAAINRKCRVVILDGGDGLSVYVHVVPDAALRTGQAVLPSARLGTMMPKTRVPCSEVYPYEHVHLGMAKVTSVKTIGAVTATTASYISLTTQSFCGHTVAALNGSSTNILLDGLTTRASEQFAVPPPC